ncbi:MAG: zinc metallopeptidase [Clostridium sp.]|nr:zinc metallopeptidase [Clostridium sp.]
MDYDLYIIINWTIPLIGFLITLASQVYININYKIHKGHINAKNKTGYDAARAILDANNLNDIDVIETKGTLTDHYDPNRKVIRLSTRVFHDASVASVAVAAHECGHAIQDKEGYNFLRIRSFLVPFVNFSTRLGYIVVFIGLLFSSYNVAMIGIALLMAMLLFQLVTLPVEFNASNRAKKEIEKLDMLNSDEKNGMSRMLTSAALTYVASLTTTLLQIFRLFLIVANNRDKN